MARKSDSEQLNNKIPAVSDEFTLESIMREFGSTPEQPATMQRSDTIVFQHVESEPPVIENPDIVKVSDYHGNIITQREEGPELLPLPEHPSRVIREELKEVLPESEENPDAKERRRRKKSKSSRPADMPGVSSEKVNGSVDSTQSSPRERVEAVASASGSPAQESTPGKKKHRKKHAPVTPLPAAEQAAVPVGATAAAAAETATATIKVIPIHPVSEPDAFEAPEPRRAKRKKSAPAAEKLPPPTLEELFAEAKKGIHWLRWRNIILLLLAGFSAVIVASKLFHWNLIPLSDNLLPQVFAGILIVALLFGIEVPVQAFLDLFKLRISLYTLGTIASVCSIIDVFLDGSQPYCAVATLLVFMLHRSVLKSRSARFYTLKNASSFQHPMGVCNVPGLFKDSDGLKREEGDLAYYAEHLNQLDFPSIAMCIYSYMILLATVISAVALALTVQINFVHCWMLLLLCAIPFYAVLSYHSTHAYYAKKLSRFHGALCGWHSTTVFSKKHTVVLKDEDLFPKKNITSNGMKLVGSYQASTVIAYALAVLQAIDSPLSDMFERLLQEQYGMHFTVDAYRFYDFGGVGAQIHGDSVLVGTLSFMRSMGVHMPDGSRIRSAIYVSVNGELVGIFALKYKPTPSVREGLINLLNDPKIRVVMATRDFLITPELVADRYETNITGLVFPNYSDRIRLSEQNASMTAFQGALISDDSFGAFASSAAYSRRLGKVSLITLWTSLISGLIGLLVGILLVFWGAAGTASPQHIAAFQIVWSALCSFIAFLWTHF